MKWFRTIKLNDSQAICTPGLVSNKWWLQGSHGKIWTPLFVRFAFEQGWYSLYTNFPNQEAFAINFRESGLNFKQTRGPINSLVKRLEPSLHFNFTRRVPIFDFYFEEIQQEATLGFRSSLWHHTHFTNQCYIEPRLPRKWKARLTKIPRRINKNQRFISSYLTNSSRYSRSQTSIANQLLLTPDCCEWFVSLQVLIIVPTLLVTWLWICYFNRQRNALQRKYKKLSKKVQSVCTWLSRTCVMCIWICLWRCINLSERYLLKS